MPTIQSRYQAIKDRIALAAKAAGRAPAEITLLWVSKQATIEQAQALVDLGQHQLGENRLAHLTDMVEHLHASEPLIWHFIGHVQRRKVAQVIRYCNWVQSLDSLSLAEKMQQEAALQGRIIQVLIQVNVSGEVQKTGVAVAAVPALLQAVAAMPNLCCRGLMCMAPFTEDPQTSRPIFEKAHALFDKIKNSEAAGTTFDTLSMGMSGDFEVAIACGATMVRIGSAIVLD